MEGVESGNDEGGHSAAIRRPTHSLGLTLLNVLLIINRVEAEAQTEKNEYLKFCLGISMV